MTAVHRNTVALELTPELMGLVHQGCKVFTIRTGYVHRRIQCEDRVLLYDADSHVRKEVWRVKHICINDLDRDGLKRLGYKSKRAMVKDLRKYYPDLIRDHWLTVIYWRA